MIALLVIGWFLAAPVVTYVGGSRKDLAASVAVAQDGTAYLAGSFSSFNFQGRSRKGADWMGYVARVNPTGEVLSWRSLGGSFQNFSFSIAVDGTGEVIVVGCTGSDDFPVFGTGIQRAFGGKRSSLGSGDAFAIKLSPDLQQVRWATQVGGAGDESAQSVLVDAAGDVWLGGWSDSTGFVALLDGKSGALKRKWDIPQPVRAMSWDRHRQRILLAGGLGRLGGVDRADYFESGFVAYLDGPSKSVRDFLPRAVAVDLRGRVWIGGEGRIVRLAASLDRIEFSPSLRGSFVVDALSACPDGEVAAVGTAHSSDYVVTPDALQRTKFDNNVPFLTIFNGDRVRYSTFLGSGLKSTPTMAHQRNQRAHSIVCSEKIFIGGDADDLLLGLGKKPGGTDGFLLQLPSQKRRR